MVEETMAKNNSKEDKQGRDVLDLGLVRLLEKDDILPLDLYTASLLGDYQVVRELISNGTNVNRSNYSGWTALMYSAYVGKDTVVNLLLESGVEVDAAVPSTGMNAMMYAASCGNESVVYFLLQQGGKVNMRDHSGRTSLFHAAHRGNVNVVKLLLDQKADIELGHGETGNTPLIETAAEGYEVIFSLLMEHGANLEARNKNGETARLLAERYGNTMIINIIDQRAREPSYTSLRSEAWLGDGGHGRVSNPDERTRTTSHGVKDAWGTATACQSFPPKTGTASPFYVDVDNKKNNVMIGPLRSRDMVAPIDLADHELSSHTFYSLGSETDGTSFNHLEIPHENIRDPLGYSGERKDIPCNEKGGQMEYYGRVSPKPNKPSRVFTDAPTNVHGVDSKGRSQANSLPDLLQEINLSKYLQCFEQNGVDFNKFLTLTDDNLKDLGVDKLGPRKKMISAIQRYNNDRKASKEGKNDKYHPDHQKPVDPATQLKQAHALIKQLESQLYKEQLTRTEMEAYFVSEQSRLTRVLHLALETKRDCEDAVKKLTSAQQLQTDVSGRISALKDEKKLEDVFPVKETQKNILDVQRTLEGQLVSLGTNLTVALKQVEQILQVLQIENLTDLHQQGAG